MARPLHPLQITERIRDTYLRYLKTIYPFREPDLRDQFWRALETPDLLVKGPLLEASPPFKPGRSIDQLAASGVLHQRFRVLCTDVLPLERPLYLHQERGIVKVVSEKRNVVVSTGTGSGKTEAFLIPILDHLLREEEMGTLGQPGVRALLLYPMNALANDQLKRLRRVLADYPAITFGRYTGETKETDRDAEDAFRDQPPHEARLDNELISREQMRQAPPHILLTNYAMLEYLLLRPRDCEFFDGETGRHWRFIVLDEAHVYDGASGIEIAMLMRRLKDRVVRSERGRLRCIATSATLGRGEKDFPAVARFASEIFGETFRWIDEDADQQDAIAAERLPMTAMGEPWGWGSPQLYSALQDALHLPDESEGDAVRRMARIAVQHGVPRRAIEDLLPQLSSASSVDQFLYHLLRGDERLRSLQDSLAGEPHFLNELAADIFPTSVEMGEPITLPAEQLISLVNLAVRARPDPDSLSLLPARYHVFARALEGAFVCLNAPAHQGADDDPGRLFLTRRKECPHCGAQVMEAATCVRCGTAYLVGRLVRDAEGDRVLSLNHLTGQPDDYGGEKAYFLLSGDTVGLDEDEAVAAEEDLKEIVEDTCEPYIVCMGCGAAAPQPGLPPSEPGVRNPSALTCNCDPSFPRVTLYRVDLQGKPELRRCVACGSRSPSGVIYRFLTGQDAPVSVLATALYQTLPASTDPDMEELPGEGRKLLVFADSRQDAAFFAPYLERTYRKVLRRRLILKTLRDDPAGREGRLRLQDVVGRLQRQAEKIGLFTHRQSYDERQQRMATWLMQELIAWDRRISLEGLGLMRFRLARPDRWRPPTLLLHAPWNLTPDEVWDLFSLLLDTLRQQGAVTFPDNVDPRDEAFAPRNRELFMREDRADSAQGIFSWVPTRGNNRRLDILIRLLSRTVENTSDEHRRAAMETLRNIWHHLTDSRSVWRDHLPSENRRRVGVVRRISHLFWELVPIAETGATSYRCSRCHNLVHINLRGICPSYRCNNGDLEPVDTDEPRWSQNHYRHLYSELTPIPLSAEEHTAQWTPSEAGAVQDRFVRGELNALSCSTTFELGVDVGKLQAVLMRNVPPTTANYVQRAGRAGRRTDSAAFALTYAQRRSHDLTYYARPERMVAGRIRPPVVVVANEKIVRRHVHSVLFAAFFRWAVDERGVDFRNVGSFFDPEGNWTSGPQLLQEYTAARPPAVKAALERIVPADLLKELSIADWAWLQNLSNEEGDGILDRAVEEVREDLGLLRRLLDEAAAERTRAGLGKAMHFQGVIQTVQRRNLLGFLGSRNVLPKYGFPADVVELRTNHLPVEEAGRIELQRDLRIAISEYAPGGEVVAAKYIWTSGGLNKRPDREWPTFHYAVCPECGRFHRSVDRIDGPCQVCGANLFGRRRLYGTFIIPEFGFIVRDLPRKSGEARPQRFYSSRVYFANYAIPVEEGMPSEPAFEETPSLSSAQLQLWRRYSRYGKLALVNSGTFNRGFRICYACGHAEPAPEQPVGRRRRTEAAHHNPRTGRSCRGRLYSHHLGHEFITDVLELRFDGLLASTTNYELWLSVLYALLEGASDALGIRRDDLDGTLYPYSAGVAPAVVLFDNVPGGAGHVRRIKEELDEVIKEAWRRLDECECGPETSCYECLRNFRNQPHHDQLKRGLARDFLYNMLEAAGIAVL